DYIFINKTLSNVKITLNGGGDETVFVDTVAAGSPLTLHLGSGSSAVYLNADFGDIGANLQIAPAIDTTGVYSLNIRDSGAPNFLGGTVTMTSNSVSGLGPLDFHFDPSKLSKLNIVEKAFRNFTILSTPGVNVLGQQVLTYV